MAFYQVDQETTFEKSSFGVFEPISDRYYSPDEIDLLIVPGIIFHECGYRIGFGGGYYDRYLQNYPNATCSLVSMSLSITNGSLKVLTKKSNNYLRMFKRRIS